MSFGLTEIIFCAKTKVGSAQKTAMIESLVRCIDLTPCSVVSGTELVFVPSNERSE
jgi:hypothetical protein